MLIDSHLHLDMKEFDDDRHAVIARAVEAGVERMVTIGTETSSWRDTLELTARHDSVFAALGVHPHDASRLGGSWLEELEELLAFPKVLALGEIGLDYYRDYSSRKDQKRAFRQQLDLAMTLGRPVIIHCRDAMDDLIGILRESGANRVGGIMHCFSGDWPQARASLDLGFLISVAGPVTFAKADRLRETVARVPLDRLLVETDAPFLAPAPHRGKRNEPAYVRFVAGKLAEAKGLSLEEVADATTANIAALLSIPVGG